MTGHQQLRPVSLRISVTDRCQLRCVYCMPLTGVPKLAPSEILTFEEIVRFVHAMQERFDLRKVRITGGEPLVRHGIVDLVAMLAELGLPDLALTTNGQFLAEQAPALQRAGLRRVNVNLASINPETYQAITRGGDLNRTLAGIRAALNAGLSPVKINVVVLRGLNDGEVADLAHLGLALGCHVRFLELMPIGCAKAEFHERFVSSAEVRGKLDEMFRLVPVGAIHGDNNTTASHGRALSFSLRSQEAYYRGVGPKAPACAEAASAGRPRTARRAVPTKRSCCITYDAQYNGRGPALRSPAQPDAGGSSRNFFAVDSQGLSGTVGFISSETKPFCAGCTRLRLTSTGKLIGCLAHGQGVMIREFLRKDTSEALQTVQNLAANEINGKRLRTSFDSALAMVSVGG
ncbi:MAG: radical SAM protein [Lentisphaerae bacterium]|nr:radical SAM protein [Lentisphaerota bacterium]